MRRCLAYRGQAQRIPALAISRLAHALSLRHRGYGNVLRNVTSALVGPIQW